MGDIKKTTTGTETTGFKRPEAAQIEEWKRKHGKLYLIEVGGEMEGEEVRHVILREPKLRDLEVAQSSRAKSKRDFDFNRSIVSNCLLYQDPGTLSDDTFALAVYSKIDELIEIKEAKIKKL